MTERMYRQCVLKKGSRFQVAYIESALAVVGSYVTVKGDTGWQVFEVSEHAVTESFVRSRERDYRTQRLASDI